MKKIYSLLLLAGLFLLGAQNVKADYYVCGGMNGWTLGADVMTYDSENNLYYKLFESESGTQEFKINDGTWGWERNFGSVDNSLGDITLSQGGGTNISITFTGATIIYYSPTSDKVYAKAYVPVVPYVSLSADVNLIKDDVITLTAAAQNFAGEITYSYHYVVGAVDTEIASSTSTTQSFTVTQDWGTEIKFYVIASTATQQATSAQVTSHVVVCTVAGNQENIFGTAWDPTNTDNDMTYNEGVFTWTKQVYLTSAETMSFKVTLNHSWTESYPGEDYNKDLAVGYNVITITLNWDTKAVGCEVVNYPKVEVAGSFNEWAHEELTYNPSGYFYKNIPLTAGNREFKVIINDVWYGKNGTMTRVDCENKTFASEADNCPLLADVDGYYTFYYQNDLVSVSYPTTFTRVVNSLNYQTLCVPFDAVKPENVTIYDVTEVTASSVTIGVPDIAYLVAGHSYIIKPQVVADIVINMKSEGDEVDAPVNTYLYGILGADYKPTAALGAYVLSEGQFHLVAEDDAATVKSTRAYLKAVNASLAPALRIVEAGSGATDIQNVEGNEVAVKFIENGKLFIRKNGVVYDATGTVVK